MKHVIFDNFSVSWTFYENPLQYESIFIKLYMYPVIPNLLEWSIKPQPNSLLYLKANLGIRFYQIYGRCSNYTWVVIQSLTTAAVKVATYVRRTVFTKPTGPVKPPPSGSGLPDRFDWKPVETG